MLRFPASRGELTILGHLFSPLLYVMELSIVAIERTAQLLKQQPKSPLLLLSVVNDPNGLTHLCAGLQLQKPVSTHLSL